MALIDGRTVKWTEYIPETTLGTTPTNPTMVAFPGEITGISVESGAEFESYNILKGATDTDPLSSGQTTKTGEMHKITITLKVSGITWLPFVLMGATNTTYAPGKVAHPVSIGLIAGAEFCLLKGCVPASAVLDFPDTKTAGTLTLTYMCIEKTAWSATDYKGTGTHAAAASAAAYTMASITNFLYDDATPATAKINLESLKISFENTIEPVFDLSVVAASKIGDYAYLSRSIVVEMGMSMIEMAAHDSLLAAAAHTVKFSLGSKAFTFSGVKWTNAPSVDLGPAAKVGMTLTSDGGATRIAIA